jgi:Carboxypeptidase regulatory-like domain
VSGCSVRFLAGQQAFGQITMSDIVGNVSKATGAVVTNAKVAVTIAATGDTRKQLSGSDGGFVFDPLLPDPYTVTLEAPSFNRLLSNVTVRGGRPGSGWMRSCFIAGGP